MYILKTCWIGAFDEVDTFDTFAKVDAIDEVDRVDRNCTGERKSRDSSY